MIVDMRAKRFQSYAALLSVIVAVCGGNACKFIKECSKCDQNGLWCVQCNDGYHIYYFPVCSPCPINCVTCSSPNNCTKCSTGYYGRVCDLQCDDHCFNTTCNRTNGYCDSCSKYAYGSKCQKNCSNSCIDDTSSNVCDRDTGQCIYGCKPGYSAGVCGTVDGQWGQWSNYGPCSVTCGHGSMTRSRSCDQPTPQNGGQPCGGSKIETSKCNLQFCSGSAENTEQQTKDSSATLHGVAGLASLVAILGVILVVICVFKRYQKRPNNNYGVQVSNRNDTIASASEGGSENNASNIVLNLDVAREELDVQQENMLGDLYAQPDKSRKNERNDSANDQNEEYLYSMPYENDTKNFVGDEREKNNDSRNKEMLPITPLPFKMHQFMRDVGLEEINESNISEMDHTDGKVQGEKDDYYNIAGFIRRKIDKLSSFVAEKSADEYLKEFNVNIVFSYLYLTYNP